MVETHQRSLSDVHGLTCPVVNYTISCARNVLTLFNVLEKELAWRRQAGKLEGYQVLQASFPIFSLGSEHPLEGKNLAADYFRTVISCSVPHPCSSTRKLTLTRRRGCLQNVRKAYPQFSPAKNWPKLFEDARDGAVETVDATEFRMP